MQTILLASHQIDEAAALLRRGEPIAIPTETVYGLAADLFSPAAIKKIFSLKNRPADNPLIAHAANLAMVEQLADGMGPEFERLAEQFWPGPLTIVLPKKEAVPDLATAGQPTIAVRIPSHPLARRLIESVGFPLAAPSANLSGKPSPTSAQHVLEDFEGKIAAVLDGGPCAIGIESTVLSLAHGRPLLLRPGAISKEEIEQVLGVSVDWADAAAGILSPGTKYRHYAPNAPVRAGFSLPASLDADAFVLSREPTGAAPFRPLSAKTLYAFLREADRLKVKEIWILLDPVSAADAALMNRIEKASV